MTMTWNNSCGLQEGKQPRDRRRLACARLSAEVFQSIEAILFDGQIGFDIAVCRLGLRVSQPQGDDLNRHAGLQQVHGCGVAKSVGRNMGLLQRGAGLPGLTHSEPEAESDAFAGQRGAIPVGENRLVWSELLILAPLSEAARGLRPDGHGAVLAPLAVEMDDALLDVRNSQLDDLRYARSGVVEQREKQLVAPTRPRRAVDGFENGGNLRARHESKQWLVGAFTRDRAYPLGKEEKIGRALAQRVAGERTDRRQPGIARARRVATFPLKMIQEREDAFGRKNGEGDLIDRHALPARKKAQQQTKGATVGGPGVRTEVALREQVLGKKSLKELGK